VTGHRKKIVAFLMATALVGAAWRIALSVQTSSKPAEAEYGRKNSNLKTVSSVAEGESSLFANDPNFSAKTIESMGKGELFFKMMLSVLLVIVLGATAIYISKKLLPRITNSPGKKIHIMETTHIGPRKAVHLIEIDNQRFLVGSTNENIRTLAHLGPAAAEDLSDISSRKTSGPLRDLSQEVENNVRI